MTNDTTLVNSGALLKVRSNGDGAGKSFDVLLRIDTPEELQYYKNGGILPYVLRSLVGRKG